MLEPFGPEIWIADGEPLTAAMGFHYPTRMTVIRLPGGGLVVISPIGLCGEMRSAVDALGPVQALVAPNSLHHMFMSDWVNRYPGATRIAAPGLARKRPDLSIDHTLDDTPVPGWGGTLDHVLVVGNAITTEAVFFHAPSGTAIFTDLLQQLPPGWFTGWRAWVARRDLMMEPAPSVPRKFRAAFTNRALARAAIRRILAWPAHRIVMAHGTPVTENGQAFLADAFGWLKP